MWGFSGGATTPVEGLSPVAVLEGCIDRFPSLDDVLSKSPGLLGSRDGFCGGTGFRFGAMGEQGRLDAESEAVSPLGDCILC